MHLEHEPRLERNAPSNARLPHRRRSSVAVARGCVIRQTRGLKVENQNMSHRPDLTTSVQPYDQAKI